MADHDTLSLYKRIGSARMRRIIDRFYKQASQDGIIGHFFFAKDHDALVEQQFQFTARMLGASIKYQGRPIESLHQPLKIRRPHYLRRQVLLREAALTEGLPESWIDRWIEREDQLRALVMPRHD